jgi:hypothetical protein
MGLPKAPKPVIQKPLPKAPDEPETLNPDDIVLGTEEQGAATAALLGKRALSRPLGVSGVGGI